MTYFFFFFILIYYIFFFFYLIFFFFFFYIFYFFLYIVDIYLLSRYSYLYSFSVCFYYNEPLIHTLFYIIGKIGNFSLLSSTAMGTITTLIVLAGYKIIYNKNYNFANYSFFL